MGRRTAARIAHSIARPTTSTSARRHAASSRTPRAHGSVAVTFSQLHSIGTLLTAPSVPTTRPDTWVRKPEAPTSTSAPRLFGTSGPDGSAAGSGAGAGVAAEAASAGAGWRRSWRSSPGSR